MPHGLMTGLGLPYTMQYLMPQTIYVEVAEQLGLDGTEVQKQKKLVQTVFELYKQIGMPITLREAGVPEEAYMDKISGYADMALKDANIISCPKDPKKEELERIYRAFYTGSY